MGLHLITGYAGAEHVTANNAGHFNAQVLGADNKVFEYGKQFDHNLNSNNEIRIYDGQGMINGRHFEMPKNTYEDLTISNGEQNMQRHDLVVVRYQMDHDTGIESTKLVVIEGESASDSPADPDYNEGSVLEGDTLVDFPLYRITIEGLSVTGVDKLFTTTKSTQEQIDKLNNDLSDTNETVSQLNSKLSNISSGAVLLAEYNGTSGANIWASIQFNNKESIVNFRFLIVQIWRSDNVIFPCTQVVPKDVFLMHNYATPILLYVPVINGLTTGEVLGYIGVESVTSCAMRISHPNYNLKLFGIK